MPYIYGLRAKTSDQYFYIGSTKFTPAQRWQNHLSYIKSGLNKNRHFVNTINQIGAENIAVDTLAECPHDERFELEYEIMDNYLKQGHKLTNIVHTLEQFRSHGYQLRSAQEEYIEYVMRPDVFIPNFQRFLEGNYIAKNPSNQGIMDALFDEAWRALERLRVINPNWLQDLGYL